MNIPTLTFHAVPNIPLIQQGDDLPRLITAAAHAANLTFADGDILIVTSKIVSKAEGRVVRLVDVLPSDEAYRLASMTGKDPRMVELVLRESSEVSRAAPNVLVVRHKLGFVSANAGIDQSNVEGGDDVALLLPQDPDASAAQLRAAISAHTGATVGVIISDSHGRAWRVGNIGVAIGVAGLPAVRDLRGSEDMFGRTLKISIQGYADMIASAAALLSGEGAEGLPVVLARGLTAAGDGKASDIYRTAEGDLYR
jgi:coenzyme F420-0:L-glutamate ligase / coenzyme F420-1:gamma-L-glutamate ligase